MTLYELNSIISGTIEDMFPDALWVEGELLEGRQGGGGHFYGEIVERDTPVNEVVGGGNDIIARARITIWARNYNILALRFREETGQTLRAGLRVKLLCRVTFHETYGYSLNVLDIDSTYTLGDQVRRRQEILRQLEKDGIINDNKTLPLPRLLRRVAVISSPSAAGWGDFQRQLHENQYSLRFESKLFPAIMQGQQAPESIIEAIEEIINSEQQSEGTGFDCIVIIRGGGASADLSDFDSYVLAACIAQCSLPVFIGIGHDRDETVLDHVAHSAFKTPTAVAAYLVEHQAAELALLEELEARLPLLINQRLQTEKHRLQMLEETLPQKGRMLMERLRHQLDMLEMRLKGLDPSLLLQRGYSITTCGGKIVKDASEVTDGDVLVTQLAKGKIESIVKSYEQ